jgi:hypothetical protein
VARTRGVTRTDVSGIRLDGANFQDDAVVDLGADFSVGPASLAGTGRPTVPITVDGDGYVGPLDLAILAAYLGLGSLVCH